MAAFRLVLRSLLSIERHFGSVSLSLKAGMRHFCIDAPIRESTTTDDCQDSGSSSGEIKASLGMGEAENRVPIATSHYVDEVLREWIGGESCLKPPNPAACSKRIQSLCSLGEVDKAHALLKAMVEKKIALKAHYFDSVIVAYSKAGRLQKAREVFEDMHKFGFRPHQISYHTLMSCYLKWGKALEALDMFDKMQQDRWQPNEVTRSIVAYGLCKTGHTEQVRALFQERCGKSGIVSTSVCNALLENFFRSGDVDAAEELGKRILSGLCCPNAYTYATIIRGRCAQGKFDEAQKVFLEMEKVGCKPILACYGSLISGLCRSGRCREAYDLFKDMLDRGIDAEGAFCGLLLKQLALKGMIDEAMRVCKYEVGKGRFVEDTAVVLILEGLSNAGRLGEAKHFLEGVMKKGGLSYSCRLQQALHTLERREAILKGSSPLKSQDPTNHSKDG